MKNSQQWNVVICNVILTFLALMVLITEIKNGGNVILTFTVVENKESIELNYAISDEELSNDQIVICMDTMHEKFSVTELVASYGSRILYDLKGQEVVIVMQGVSGCVGEMGEDSLNISLIDGSRPEIVFKSDFSKELIKKRQMADMLYFYLIVGAYLMFGILQLCRKSLDSYNRKKSRFWIGVVGADAFLCIGVLLNYGMNYLMQNFGNVPLSQLLFHMNTPLDGSNMSTFYETFKTGGVIVCTITGVTVFVGSCLLRIRKSRGYAGWLFLLGVMIWGRVLTVAIVQLNVEDYLKFLYEETELYDNYYVDGRDVEITFPEEKRNLIYIVLESMETTYADTGVGGAMESNYIPKLSRLALDYECFSDGTMLNGAYNLAGAGFTMGGLTAQTSGTPINMNVVGDTLNTEHENEGDVLPGVWAIGDILAQQGYKQEFLLGSDVRFAARGAYFMDHGNYDIFDYNTAIMRGLIASDYYVWWGYEDQKLFAYAREELKSLAAGDEPFNLTMLTVDTHFTDGYVCDLCPSECDKQYSNVIRCADNQVAEFIAWIMEQDFYENTMIVIAGDHCTMDSAYINNMGADNYDRKSYVAIINPAENCVTNGSVRRYSTFDLYPTTVAGLGASIEGERLGLGVNLYSGEKTLIEELGRQVLEEELQKHSGYYNTKLLYGR